MTETLTHNLELLSEDTKTLTGFILKMSKSGFEIIASFNEQILDIIPLGNDLHSLFMSKMLNEENISNSESFLYLSAQNDIKSILFENVFESDNGDSVFLLLLSNIKDNYTKENLSLTRKYIMELNKQIQETTSEELISDKNVQSYQGEWFTQHRELIFSTLLNSYNDLLFILDDIGYIIAVSKIGARSLDYSELEMRGKHLFDYVKSEEKQVVVEAFKNTLLNKGILELDITLIGKYENKIPFRINCSLIKEDGKMIGMLGTGRNLMELRAQLNKNTEIKNRLIETLRLINIEKKRSDIYKDILSDLNRLRNDFVSNLSHEFRTPLASIIGFAETLISDKEMPEEMRKEFDEIILQEGKRLAKLINDILELSRYEQGKIELNKSEFDVTDLLKTILEEIAPAIENKGLILTCNFPSSPVKLIADKEKMKLVFNGILNNSIKYTPSKGRISCMIKIFREEIEIIFTDTGSGISEKEFPYIFHKFYRSSKGSQEFIPNDVDLVFIKQIIDLHKGIIKVQSEQDKGTSVLIKLPNKPNYN
jgi:PAS domain S-box-containing protein